MTGLSLTLMYLLNDRTMAESAKVRVVRCPKCENLLPELEDYPVYQCGGCGAVLRGKFSCFFPLLQLQLDSFIKFVLDVVEKGCFILCS